MIWTPEDQIDIFEVMEEIPKYPDDTLFNPGLANWHQKSFWAEYMPHEWLCLVIGVIPEDIKQPTEMRSRGGYPPAEFGERIDIWSAYVWGISQLIPLEERPKNDVNGWEMAIDVLRQARDEKQPIQMAIWKSRAQYFKDLEVIEYLPEPTGSRSVQHE